MNEGPRDLVVEKLRHPVPWAWILGLFLATRALLFVATLINWPLAPCREYQVIDAAGATRMQTIPWQSAPDGRQYMIAEDSHFDAFARMDAEYYLKVAYLGYTTDPDGRPSHHAGFFPGYPIVCRILAAGVSAASGHGTDFGQLPRPTLLAIAWGVANGALLLAAFAIWRLANLLFDPAVARRAVGCLLCWPFAFFGAACLSESLFLLASTEALRFALRRRFILAGIFGAAAAFTRPLGVLLVLPLLAASFERRTAPRQVFRDALAIGLVAVGPLAVIIWHHLVLGRAGAWLEVQSDYGHSGFPSLAGVAQMFRIPGQTGLDQVRNVIQVASLGLALVGLAGLLRRRSDGPPSWTLVTAALVLAAVPLLSGNVISMPRYLWAIAPLSIGAARLLPGRRPGLVLALVGLAAQVAGFVVFIRAWPILI